MDQICAFCRDCIGRESPNTKRVHNKRFLRKWQSLLNTQRIYYIQYRLFRIKYCIKMPTFFIKFTLLSARNISRIKVFSIVE